MLHLQNFEHAFAAHFIKCIFAVVLTDGCMHHALGWGGRKRRGGVRAGGSGKGVRLAASWHAPMHTPMHTHVHIYTHFLFIVFVAGWYLQQTKRR